MPDSRPDNLDGMLPLQIMSEQCPIMSGQSKARFGQMDCAAHGLRLPKALWGLGATSASSCLPQPHRGIVRSHAARKRHEVKPVSDEARAQYTSANAVGRDMSEGTLP